MRGLLVCCDSLDLLVIVYFVQYLVVAMSKGKPLRSRKKTTYRKSTSTVDVEKYPSPISVRVALEPTKVTSEELVLRPDLIDDLFSEQLLNELHSLPQDWWVRWHRDAHWILEEKHAWREQVSTWGRLLQQVESAFQMSINASRLNRFSDPEDFKPFHHDASAIIPSRAKDQNVSVVLCLGVGRPVRFYHSGSRSTLDFHIAHKGAYAFGAGLNSRWMHGVGKGEMTNRISIAFWGWTDA